MSPSRDIHDDLFDYLCCVKRSTVVITVILYKITRLLSINKHTQEFLFIIRDKPRDKKMVSLVRGSSGHTGVTRPGQTHKKPNDLKHVNVRSVCVVCVCVCGV